MTVPVKEPIEPKLVQHLLEDLLEWGVSVLARTKEGAPERQVVSFAQPEDTQCSQISAYPGTILPFPDFQRQESTGPQLSPKVKLWLRWTRCMTTPEGQEDLDPEIVAEDAYFLTEDAYRMAYAFGFAKADDTLFRRYTISQIQHVQFVGVEAIPQQSGTAGYQLAIEVQLSSYAART